jgi:hypothetical protein
MTRPLMQMGIGQLEELFAKSKADQKVLKQLEHELQYRQVPRAVALLPEVQAVMYGEAPSTRPPPAPTVPPTPTIPEHQPELWARPTQQPVPAPVPALQVVQTQPAVRPPSVPPASKPAAPPVVAMPVEDAYKVLKATSGSTWEAIEQTRRQLVEQSHPERLKAMAAERRSSALVEAKRVNTAYATLSRVRCGGH